MSSFELRPHHGLCIAFFEGKGYNPEFIRHMAEMISYLDCCNPEIRLVLHTDRICSACPHNRNSVCESAQKVLSYDRAVLSLCGLEENQVLLWKDFQSLVRLKILQQRSISAVCRDCQWLCICSGKQQKFLTFSDKYDKIAL
ncbi:MAG: DUF1284 domain-containing protein [Ruminococcus sp.]|nr:DUF1284 domain-containing protein [Ruminococcus sp.]